MAIVGNNVPAKQASKPLDAMQLMESYKDQIKRALPKHMSADRVARIALTEMRRNPKLMNCDPYSILGAVIQSAQLGLEVGSGLGHAYLVPYKTECTLITGYKGQVDLARRGGRIKSLMAYLVYPEDRFDEGVRDGEPFLDYVPARLGKERDPDKEAIGAFAIASFDNSATQWVFMEKWEIDRIRDNLRYPSDIWKEHYGEMAKKTVIRRLSKLLPQSPELVQANAIEDGERPSHQPFIDMNVLPESYEPHGPAHDPAKVMAESAAAANSHEMTNEQINREEKELHEKNEAITDFQKTAAEFEQLGGDLKTTLKLSKLEVIKLETPRIRGATAVMKKQIIEATKAKGTK